MYSTCQRKKYEIDDNVAKKQTMTYQRKWRKRPSWIVQAESAKVEPNEAQCATQPRDAPSIHHQPWDSSVCTVEVELTQRLDKQWLEASFELQGSASPLRW